MPNINNNSPVLSPISFPSFPKKEESKAGLFYRKIAQAKPEGSAQATIKKAIICNHRFRILESQKSGGSKQFSIAHNIYTNQKYACLDAPAGQEDPIQAELYMYEQLKISNFQKILPILYKEFYNDENGLPRIRLFFPLCRSLEQAILKNSISPAEQNRIFVEAGLILCDFLDCGFIHRDIKPGNFLLDENNRVFLIDLDTSGKPGQVGWEKETAFRGTESYAAPETLTLKNKESESRQNLLATQGEKADIYAYGLTALELYGKLSIENLPKDESVQKAVADVKSTLPKTPEFDLIKKMVEEDPAKRPDREEIRTELNHIHAYRSWLTRHPGSSRTFEEFCEYRSWHAKNSHSSITFEEFTEYQSYRIKNPDSQITLKELREDRSWRSQHSPIHSNITIEELRFGSWAAGHSASVF